METTAPAIRSTVHLPAEIDYSRRRPDGHRKQTSDGQNVAGSERIVSLAAGAILAGLGLARRDAVGAVIGIVGGALAYRGATGHCHMYQALGVDTCHTDAMRDLEEQGVEVVENFTIHKSAEELYSSWKNFERLPEFMSHLESVRVIDEKRSEWVAKAPWIAGGEMKWEAEITEDQPNQRIAWQTVEGSSVDHRGSVTFRPAPGDRGTRVRVELTYAPPAGQIGRWMAKLFGEEPEQQVRSDLRKFKRLMEIGEVPTTEGQPHGKCSGLGRLFHG
jgi:uncharacterized membrane protein